MSNSALDGNSPARPPVAVGGVGGSGTRLIAQILKAEGYFLGVDLNEASDNLWFTLLFKRPPVLGCSDGEFVDLCEIFAKGMVGRGGFTPEQQVTIQHLAVDGRVEHDPKWLKDRAVSLLSRYASHDATNRWGWKEPNTHVVLDRLNRAFPGMKYIFVSRHGLDMAVSENQGQPRLWGPILLGEPFEATPRYSLRYWCFVHRRVRAIGDGMGENFLFLSYDDLCRDTKQGLAKLRAFLGTEDANVPQRLLDLVSASPTIDRYKLRRRDEFDADDIAYVESLGFAVTGFARHQG